jgi:heme oxygenase
MYMGMLFGGRAIRVWCQRAFRQKTADGTRSFRFDETIADSAAFRARYFDALNSLTLSREERDAIIEQKCKVFDMNGQLFAELRASKPYRLRVITILMVAVFCMFIVWAIFTQVRTWLATSQYHVS